MPAPRKYSDELRERAVRMVEETLKENPGLAHERACARVGDQLGIPGATLRNWFLNGVAGGHAPRAVVVTGRPGRPDRAAGKGEPGAAAGERDPQERVGFLRGGARPPLASLIAYIDQHRQEFGVEPICTVLSDADAKIAPSTYYAAKTRPPSSRTVADAALDVRITALFEENYRVYGSARCGRR